MKKKELIIEVLDELGYKPQEDNDGDLMVRYQMKNIFILVGNEEEKYISMMLPQFSEIEDGEETLVLACCNKVTRELKLVKTYIDQTFKNVSATCEFFYTDEESLKQNISESLHILGVVRSIYRNTKLELTE